MAAANPAGKIAFALTQRGVVAGVVTDRNASRASVLVDGGGRETWSDDRIFWVSDVRVPLHSARAALDGMAAFLDRVQEAREALDLEVLWDLVADDGSRLTVGDMADLACPGGGPEAAAATACALAEDDTYFRSLGDREYGPLPREAVEATRRRRQREAQERDQVERTADRLAARLAEGLPHDPADAVARNGVAWLRTLAVQGAEDRESARGLQLLQHLGGGAAPPSDPDLAAFQVLVKLSVFEEDEILGVHRYRIRREFPAEVEAEAARLAVAPLADVEARDRPLLAATPGHAGPIAIDDPWTTEVDDALMVEPVDGATRVHVLIADPTATVPLDSRLGEEGVARAATLYLPTGKVPMLPEVLSTRALSLTAGETRPMLDFACDLAGDGRVLAFRVVPVFATLACRLTYDEADRRVAAPDPADPLDATLASLASLAAGLQARRVEAGAVLVERDEVSVRVEAGEVVCRRLPWDSPGRRLVAEFMVLACSQAGSFARANGIPTVYRRQNPPDDRNAVAGLKPGSKAYAYRMIRSLRRAELTTQPDFHWGLGVVGYTQVTSPLRRFQDFIEHLQLKGFLRTGRAPLDTDRILRLFGDLETRADAVTQTEREAKRYYLLKYLKRSVGADVTAEVVATSGSRAIVQLDETGLELPVAGAGHLPLATRLTVRVRDVDPRRDRVSLVL